MKRSTRRDANPTPTHQTPTTASLATVVSLTHPNPLPPPSLAPPSRLSTPRSRPLALEDPSIETDQLSPRHSDARTPNSCRQREWSRTGFQPDFTCITGGSAAPNPGTRYHQPAPHRLNRRFTRNDGGSCGGAPGSRTERQRPPHNRTTSAPQPHHVRPTTAPRPPHDRTTSAPRPHHDRTTSAPQLPTTTL